MYPHERSLVARLIDKPFVLVGVNADADREQIKQRIKDEHITWRSWWDQPAPASSAAAPTVIAGGMVTIASSPTVNGTIAEQWHIRQWPSIFVIDANGVIRFKDVRGQDLDNAIDGMLRKMGVTVQPHAPPPE
jgi:hypothetical protein